MKIKKLLSWVSISLLAVMMIGLGLHQVLRVYQSYREAMLDYQSQQLNSTVRASARGLDLLLNGYDQQVNMYLARREFALAEEEYEASGNADAMWMLMARPDIRRPDMPCSVAVYDMNGAFLAASSYQYPVDSGSDDAVGSLVVRTDAFQVRWFIFSATSAAGYRYEVAVPVQSLFEDLGENTRVGGDGYLFLIDTSGSFISYFRNGTGGTCSLDEMQERNPSVQKDEILRLANRDKLDQDDYIDTQMIWPEGNGTAEETLVVSTPVLSSDGGLVMCASLRFAEFDTFLSDTLGRITSIILLEIGGALILLCLAAWAIVLNRRDQLELKAVRERADLMEEVNRQQQSLAHTERLQQLGVMTGGIVHECNNLLTPIMGQSMLLLEELEEDSPQFERTLDIYEASEHARDVLRRMSSLGKKNVDMSFSKLEIGALLRKTMNLAAMAKDPHILQELTLPDEPLYVSGNEQLLTQAILNLCINACQAMGNEGTLLVTAAPDTRSGREYVEIQVCDTGPGIPEEKMDSIFVPFYTTKGNQGTGVGLAICQKILETHKGTVQAANRPEGGAVLTVRIPTCDPPELE